MHQQLGLINNRAATTKLQLSGVCVVLGARSLLSICERGDHDLSLICLDYILKWTVVCESSVVAPSNDHNDTRRAKITGQTQIMAAKGGEC